MSSFPVTCSTYNNKNTLKLYLNFFFYQFIYLGMYTLAKIMVILCCKKNPNKMYFPVNLSFSVLVLQDGFYRFKLFSLRYSKKVGDRSYDVLTKLQGHTVLKKRSDCLKGFNIMPREQRKIKTIAYVSQGFVPNGSQISRHLFTLTEFSCRFFQTVFE